VFDLVAVVDKVKDRIAQDRFHIQQREAMLLSTRPKQMVLRIELGKEC